MALSEATTCATRAGDRQYYIEMIRHDPQLLWDIYQLTVDDKTGLHQVFAACAQNTGASRLCIDNAVEAFLARGEIPDCVLQCASAKLATQT